MAVVIGENLLTTQDGVLCLHKMVIEDIEHAIESHDHDKALRFSETYKLVSERHPLKPGSQSRH